ncbi:MAG: hypothetical protein NT157_01740 [Candidatus Micrarchaeota archaeon]|nr:hypothetical protein [Candidatus Micrarchaeota archaeon]
MSISSEISELLRNRRIQMLLLLLVLALALAYFHGIKFGIEFEGGTRIPIRLEPSADQPINSQVTAEVVEKLKTRLGKFGLTQVVVKAVGESQVYVEIPKSDSTLVSELEKIVKQKGRYEGVVDGKLAIDGREIIPGSIQQEGVKTQGNQVTWSVGFAITRESAEKFAAAAKGKAGYPVYMYLDRPSDAFVIISSKDLLENTSLSSSEALELLDKALTKDESRIPVFVLGDWETVKGQISAGNFTNETEAIVSQELDPAIVSELSTEFNFTVRNFTRAEMVPSFNTLSEIQYATAWQAVGLMSAPVLTEGVTTGSAGQLYTINGPAPGATVSERQANAYAEMKRIKSVLSGGALPVRVTLGSVTAIPAPLGSEFLRYSVIGLAMALVSVVMLISYRYRNVKLILPIMVISLTEMTILVCVLGSFTIDLSTMAGLIASMGTSVDAQIVVTDELRKKTDESTKNKLKKAFDIVVARTVVATLAMVPLLFSGLVEIIGFATSLILGMALGIMLTMPAYGAIAEKIMKGAK